MEDTSRLLAGTDDKFSLRYKTSDEESDASDVDGEDQSDGARDDNDQEDAGLDSDSQSEGESDSEKNVDEDVEDANARSMVGDSSRKSIVDDQFFKLSEMEAFLDAEDKKEMRKSKGTYFEHGDEEIDYFNGDFSEDDADEDGDTEATAKYSEFFAGDGEYEQEHRRKKREARNAKNKLTEKRKKEDLGLDDSDIENVDGPGVDELDDQEDGDEQEEEDSQEERVSRKGEKSFDMSKNDYHSDSNDDDDDDEEDKDSNRWNVDSENKSSFQLRQERLQNRINEFEKAAVGEKTWQLKGEVTSATRPQNSLLEEVLEFDSTARPAPIITEETTLQLEDIIKQRIKDKAWNDVERKYKPVNTPQEFRKKLVLDQEKSKESLAKIYEKEYLKEVAKVDPNHDDKDEDEPKEHQEIRTLMKSLFLKLDALSHFYYTPRPAVPEVKIITNIPAINMEEVGPVGVSDATLLAPEEVRHHAKGDVMGKSERTSTDKKRERRMKKLKQKSIHIAKEKRTAEKEKLGISLTSKEERAKLMNKVTKSRNVQKMKETTDGKAMKSSKAFFSQLQDEVTQKTKTKSKRKAAKNDGDASAKKLKL